VPDAAAGEKNNGLLRASVVHRSGGCPT
jgi:hypothetical protein